MVSGYPEVSMMLVLGRRHEFLKSTKHFSKMVNGCGQILPTLCKHGVRHHTKSSVFYSLVLLRSNKNYKGQRRIHPKTLLTTTMCPKSAFGLSTASAFSRDGGLPCVDSVSKLIIAKDCSMLAFGLQHVFIFMHLL